MTTTRTIAVRVRPIKPKALPATANPLPLYLFGSWSILFMPDLAKTIAAIHPNPPTTGNGKNPKTPKIKLESLVLKKST